MQYDGKNKFSMEQDYSTLGQILPKTEYNLEQNIGDFSYQTQNAGQSNFDMSNMSQYTSSHSQVSSMPHSEGSVMEKQETTLHTYTSQSNTAYFGGEPLTLYASGGEPVTLYANNAGVVSQGFQVQQKQPVQISQTRKSTKTITLLPPPGMTKKYLQHRSMQSQPRQTQISQYHKPNQNPMMVNIQTRPQKSQQMLHNSGVDNDETTIRPRLINILPNSGEVEKVKVIAPTQRFYPMDSSKPAESYKISLIFDEYSNPLVNLSGNKKKFIQHIHQAVLNFMRDHKIPDASFCQNVLNKEEVDALPIFLSRCSWDVLNIEEKLMYLKLSKWMKEPVSKRMYDLIQKEKNIERKTEMTNQYVEATTIKRVLKKPQHILTENNPILKSRESIPIDISARDSPSNIFQTAHFDEKYSHPQEEFTEQPSAVTNPGQVDGEDILAELQANRLHGPPRSRTTLVERTAIRGWARKSPNSSPEERTDLARSLGLTKLTVDRILSYDKRMIRKQTNRSEENKSDEKFRNNDLVGNSVYWTRKQITETPAVKIPVENQEKSSLYEESDKPNVETYFNKTDVSIPPLMVTKNPSQFIQINSEKLKCVIRNAMKSSGSGMGSFDPKKPFKVIVRPADGSSKYNNLALDSYFKNKPSPTETQIEYFVECTKVPYKVTKDYLERKTKSATPVVAIPDYVAARNNEFQSRITQISDTKRSAINPCIQQLNAGAVLQPNSQLQPQLEHTEPQPGQPPNLSQEQFNWIENFFHNTLNPDMQTIIDFSKSIEVPFGTVAEFLEKMSDSQSQATAENAFEVQANANDRENIPDIEPELLDLVRKIKRKNYSSVLDKELKSLFGNKIFCTLDDIKSFAATNHLKYQDIFRKLNNKDGIQLVSGETCRRVIGEAFNKVKDEPLEYDEALVKNVGGNVDDKPNKFIEQEFSTSRIVENSSDQPQLISPAETPSTSDVLRTKQDICKTYNSLSISLVPKNPPKVNIKQEAPEDNGSAIPLNNWLTSTELLFEENDPRSNSDKSNVVCKTEPLFGNEASNSFDNEFGTTVIEIDVETSEEPNQNSTKRKPSDVDLHFSSKRHKSSGDNLSYDDSGYTTSQDSMNEGNDILANSDLLSNIIMENIGEVNMLDDSLNLFNDSIKGIDLVNDLFQKIENEDALDMMNDHVKVKMEVEDLVEEEMLKNIDEIETPHESTDEGEKNEDPNSFSDLRKVFYGPFENFNPHFQVVSIKPGFKSDVFEVELSDGQEFSNNFYFKTGSSELKINLMIKMKHLRYIGARICVESFESLNLENCILGNPDPIEDEFFSKLRSIKLEPRDIFEVSSPKTIMEYILLEENIRTFIESFGCNIELFKFSTGDVELKKEILFNLCKYRKRFSSKLLKVLSCHLNMEKAEIETFIAANKHKFNEATSSIFHDHGYSNLYKMLG